MTIRIVTDSTCDLPAALVAEHGITVAPLYINFGLESYLDGVDLSREDFYARLPDADPPPTTAMPGLQMFRSVYEKLMEEGATEILSVHIAGSLSGVADAARLAAGEVSAAVTVFDSGTLSLGTGFLVLAAAEAAAQGRTMDEIVAAMNEQGQRTHVIAALDTLEFLRRSGRVNRLMAAFGSVLRIKPLLKMHDGVASAERVRTSRAATRRLIALLEEQLPLEQVALVHTHANEKAQDLRQNAQHLLPEGEILSVDITPIFGTHLGPGAVGFVYVSAREKAKT